MYVFVSYVYISYDIGAMMIDLNCFWGSSGTARLLNESTSSTMLQPFHIYIYIYILYIYLIFHFPDFISHFTSMDHFVFPLMTYQIEILADKCVVLPCLLVCFYLCLLLCVYFITQHTYRDREEGHTSSQERDSD